MNLQTKQWKNVAALASLACCLFMVSCSDVHDDGSIDDKPVVASFSANISAPTTRMETSQRHVVATRATGTSWELNDEVGIFMLKSGGSLMTPSDTLAANRQYYVTGISQPIDDAKDNLKPKVATEAIYLNPGTTCDFIAYYPWKGTAELTDGVQFPISLGDQTTGGARHDLLYSTASRTNVKSNAISMVFSHKLVNITIEITRGKGVNATSYVSKQAVISGMPTIANFDLSDGTTFSDVGTVANITSSRADVAGNLYEVIILPQAADAYKGRIISFTGLGKDYRWSIPDGFIFESGKRYTYRFTMTEGGLELAGDVEIEPWTEIDLNSGSGTWIGNVADILDIETVDIQPGTFTMGQADIPNATPHQVTLTNGFKMSKYQITTTQYCEFLNIIGAEGEVCKEDATLFSVYDTDGNEWVRSSNGIIYDWGIHWNGLKWIPSSGFETRPITRVSWSGAKAFCDFVKGSLPTEAQWEYACRAGTTTIWYFGSVETDLGNYAWYNASNTPETGEGYPAGPKPVGLKLPNPWNLYDMYGNAWEWNQDWYVDITDATAEIDPIGPDTGTHRVMRGGGYNGTSTLHCRSAQRSSFDPIMVNGNIGFRAIFPL